ncbi:RtcB family protein [Candidatus Coxiella mudrowiae]|uniref:RtcB family protein n=1 Tax=Candidatus Coxiella mudrowiae TaxID=2054173 RepID=UPI001F44C45A|nr:RtcB family protein [Candidatus Coxiella mudrowiae]
MPIRIYGSESLIRVMDDKVLEQITNMAQLPELVNAWPWPMPDAPIVAIASFWGVTAFDLHFSREEFIYAGSVGFDISCGIGCLQTDLTWKGLKEYREQTTSRSPLSDDSNRCRSGWSFKTLAFLSGWREVLRVGVHWTVKRGFCGIEEDLLFVEEQDQMKGPIPKNVFELAKNANTMKWGP